MSAKHAKKAPPKAPPAPSHDPVPHRGSVGAAAATADAATPAWLDSADPRKRMWGQVLLVGLWIYVAALGLLALDQTFRWGIFGPKVAPLP